MDLTKYFHINTNSEEIIEAYFHYKNLYEELQNRFDDLSSLYKNLSAVEKLNFNIQFDMIKNYQYRYYNQLTTEINNKFIKILCENIESIIISNSTLMLDIINNNDKIKNFVNLYETKLCHNFNFFYNDKDILEKIILKLDIFIKNFSKLKVLNIFLGELFMHLIIKLNLF